MKLSAGNDFTKQMLAVTAVVGALLLACPAAAQEPTATSGPTASPKNSPTTAPSNAPASQPATAPAGAWAATRPLPPPGLGATAKSKLVTNVFYDTSLRQALSDVASQTGSIIVPDATVQGMVTCDLKDVPLDKALEILLAGSGFVVKDMGGYYLVCSAAVDGPSYPLVSETQVVKLSYVQADAAVKALSATFKPYAQADISANTVCITAPRMILARIANDLKMLDKAPRHIMLDAKIVVMEKDDLQELGIQWGWPTIRAGMATNSDFHGGGLPGPDWPWGVQIGYTTGKEFTNSLLLILNLLGQNESATVLASPQVMAQDGKEAQLSVSTEEYFNITTEGLYAQSTLQKVESGTLLKIIPRIAENGDITLDMATEVSDVVGRGGQNLPVITRRITKSTVRVQDGGTAAVAGLMLSRSRLANNGVPGARSLPLLGPLFRTDTDSASSKQVAVFVTSRLMTDPSAQAQKAAKRPVIKPSGTEFQQQLRESLRRGGKARSEVVP